MGQKKDKVVKAKDTPWDAVLKGSVACTVGANVCFLIANNISVIIFFLKP